MREVMALLQEKGQMGYPPPIATDARLGYAVMAHQSAEILSGPCEGDGSILVRLEGSCSRAHPGAKHGLAQGAKAGYCPCCAKATHIATPAPYAAGESSKTEAHCSMPWGTSGP